MKKRVGWGLVVGLFISPLTVAETISLEQVLSEAIDNSLPLQIATMQTERSALEADKLNSMLGWNINGQLNYDHDVGFTGTPSDKLNAMGGMSRMLANGDVVSGNAIYSLEDSEFVFSPAFPNPAHRLNLDLNYRKPLSQGRGNPRLNNGLKKVEAGTTLSDEGRLVLKDNFATQVIEAYHGALLTRASINNSRKGVERTERLIRFVKNNAQLGLAEEKDLLQIKAQLQSQKADQSSLQLAWVQQTTALNRLMGRSYAQTFTPILKRYPAVKRSHQLLLEQAVAYSPAIRMQQAKIAMAEAVMDDVRNGKKDKLDLVMSLGTRSAYGDNAAGSTVNETDYALMVGVEYSHAADKRGVQAELQQAMLDRSIALREIENNKREIEYAVLGLVQEIEATQQAIVQYERRVKREQQKLDEAERRYQRGRTTTQELIMAENDLSLARFLLEQKRIDLSRRHARLSLLRGEIWQQITPTQPEKKG